MSCVFPSFAMITKSASTSLLNHWWMPWYHLFAHSHHVVAQSSICLMRSFRLHASTASSSSLPCMKIEYQDIGFCQKKLACDSKRLACCQNKSACHQQQIACCQKEFLHFCNQNCCHHLHRNCCLRSNHFDVHRWIRHICVLTSCAQTALSSPSLIVRPAPTCIDAFTLHVLIVCNDPDHSHLQHDSFLVNFFVVIIRVNPVLVSFTQIHVSSQRFRYISTPISMYQWLSVLWMYVWLLLAGRTAFLSEGRPSSGHRGQRSREAHGRLFQSRASKAKIGKWQVRNWGTRHGNGRTICLMFMNAQVLDNGM